MPTDPLTVPDMSLPYSQPKPAAYELLPDISLGDDQEYPGEAVMLADIAEAEAGDTQEPPTDVSRQMPSRERIAAAMQSSAANPETDARKVARLAASFAGDCNAVVVTPEESERDGPASLGTGVWTSKVCEEDRT